MAFFTGRYGSLQIGSNTILKIRDWSLDSTVELLGTNTVDSTANTFVPGVKGATGSATILYYRKESGDPAASQDFSYVLSQSAILSTRAVEFSDKLTFKLHVGTSGENGVINYIEFKGFITSVGVTVSTGELSTVPISFTMDGNFLNVP